MINGKQIIGIIPARVGSKGLPGKNWRPMCGKPLIAWTIEKALMSRHLDVIVVSTDGEYLAALARRYGAQAPFLRPAELSGDEASSYDVIRHTLDHYRLEQGREFDYAMLLEPTSPLREDGDIDRLIEALDGSSDTFDSIVSIGQIGEHPSIVKRLSGRQIEPFFAGLAPGGRRQDNAPAYFPYGVGYLAKTDRLLAENTYYMPRCMGYEIKRYQNYEIDDLYDFACVESVMKLEWSLA